jgi:hypothetical protein
LVTNSIPGGIEQHGDRRHEHDDEKVATQGRNDSPGKHAQVVEIPGPRQTHGGGGFERPILGLRFAEGNAGSLKARWAAAIQASRIAGST